MRIPGLLIITAILAFSSGLLAPRAMAEEPPPHGSGATTPNAGEWPQWRGPNRDGVAPDPTKLLDAWPAGGPKLVWKSGFIPSGSPVGGKLGGDLTGEGMGSPVVAGGKVFLFVPLRVPADGGKTFRFVTGEVLKGLPDDLAAKLAKFKDREFTTLRDFLSIRQEIGGDEDIRQELSAIMRQGTKETDTVICLDASTGKEAWRTSLPGQPMVRDEASRSFGLSSTPAISGGRCYAVGSGGPFCLDIKDGAVVWQTKGGKWANSSPLVFGGRVIYANPALTAYDAQTGKLLWSTPRAGGPWFGMPNASVVGWNAGGRSYLVGVSDSGLYCADPETGRILWNVSDCPIHEGGSTPAIQGDLVVVQAGNDVRAYRMTPQKAELEWSAPNAGEGGAGSPAIFRDKAYASAGKTGSVCIELKSGLIKERNPKSGGWHSEEGTEYSSLLIADGKLFEHVGAAADPGRIRMLHADTLDPLGLFPDAKADGILASCTSPAIADGRLYVRQQDCVACYDLAEHIPYAGRMTVDKDQMVFEIRQAEGGLSLKEGSGGAITGLMVQEASGDAKPAQARIDGSTIRVDIAGLTFPLAISYDPAVGNLCAKNGPCGRFGWRSPRLSFEQWKGNEFTLALDGVADMASWTAPKTYQVSGATVVAVDAQEKDRRLLLHLVTDGHAKIGDHVNVAYPAAPEEFPGRMAQLTFTLVPESHLAAVNLRITKAAESTVILASDVPLDQGTMWGSAETYAITGAKVTKAEVTANEVHLTTDKAWNYGETMTLSYASFPPESGDTRRATAAYTLPKVNLTAGLKLWLKLEEKNGTKAANSGDDGVDVVVTGAKWIPGGKVDGALHLNGESDYLMTSASMHKDFADGDITVALWVKPAAGGVVMSELGQHALDGGWHDSQIEIMNDGEVKIRVWQFDAVSLGKITLNHWHHLVMRYSKKDQALDGFVDGKSNQNKSNGDKQWNNGGEIYYAFGAKEGTHLGHGGFLKGALDDIRIYNRVLTDDEITALADARKP